MQQNVHYEAYIYEEVINVYIQIIKISKDRNKTTIVKI